MTISTGSTTWPEYRCPFHQRALVADEEALRCPDGDAFPIVDRIPRFVDSESYTAAFGIQWRRHARTQLDSVTGLSVSASRLRRVMGAPLWTAIAGRQVLEAGCGAGRFTEILLDRGALVTSVDLSTAVDANAATFPPDDRHRVAQCDVLSAPFAPGSFDVVLCLGVVQHTPHPETTIAALYRLARPGGWLVLDHYAPSWSWRTRTAPLFRLVLRRLSADAGLRWTERVVRALLPLHRAVRHSPVLQLLLSRISPLVTYFHALPALSDDLQREWALLDTHDALTDWYKHHRTRKQIAETLRVLGAVEAWCEQDRSRIEARARKPA